MKDVVYARIDLCAIEMVVVSRLQMTNAIVELLSTTLLSRFSLCIVVERFNMK